MNADESKELPAPDPQRFEVSRGTLLLDRFMTQLIRVGGVAVILAVFGIFFFIVKEIIPLFTSPEVEEAQQRQVEVVDAPEILGVDEWGELPFLYDGGGDLVFVSLEDGERRSIDIPELADVEVTAMSYDPVHQRVALGLADGRVGSFVVHYETEFDEDDNRSLAPEVEVEPWFEPETGEGPVEEVAYGDGGEQRMIVLVREQGVAALRLGKNQPLFGEAKLELRGETELTAEIRGEPAAVLASLNGDTVLVADDTGEMCYFLADDGEVTLRQRLQPFEGEAPARMDYIFGGESVAVSNDAGEQRIFGMFRGDDSDELRYGQMKSFPALGEGNAVFAPSLRNKSFICGAGRTLAVRHLTSGETRWTGEVDFAPVAVTIDGKMESFIIAGADGRVQRFTLHDPHPEAGWRAFFGKVWYEGGEGPVYQWQSTGGSDDFEPKLSLVPLIIGSLKGTFYALVFSVPVALLAAVFSACFLTPAMKRVVKPTMEIMASLPSVVLGFLAGLWLAPLIEDKVPSIMLVCVALPLVAVLFGVIWSRQPMWLRGRLENGREWIALLPLLILGSWAAWALGPVVEKFLFVYQDPATGERIADFRLWWPQATGLSFNQRNCVVLGFAMGFAVIPIIFTIAEDALSNVPRTLTAAASALGASRWQVVRSIVIPVASPGIFSALMIGFGRAVGETMIVVMASGNTPLTGWNIFSGMRTLSANIAVELPEAAPGSTHYRTLFLGALVLFLMTFFLNSVAEVLRQRLREKNKLV